MPLKIESRHLNGVVVLVPDVFRDQRGYFLEAFRADRFGEIGLVVHTEIAKPSSR